MSSPSPKAGESEAGLPLQLPLAERVEGEGRPPFPSFLRVGWVEFPVLASPPMLEGGIYYSREGGWIHYSEGWVSMEGALLGEELSELCAQLCGLEGGESLLSASFSFRACNHLGERTTLVEIQPQGGWRGTACPPEELGDSP